MNEFQKKYYEKRGQTLVKNLRKRHFDAYYCATREEALEKALGLIPEGKTLGWGGATSAEQIGLLKALRTGPYRGIDRDTAASPEERIQMMRQCLLTDIFIAGYIGNGDCNFACCIGWEHHQHRAVCRVG